MRYFGSKTSTVEKLFDLVSERIPSGSFCDPFGGIGTVGAFFKQKGYLVTSGDMLAFAHAYQVARIVQSELPRFRKLRSALKLPSCVSVKDHLNSLEPFSGWITREYAECRQFFTIPNAQRIDACRQTIEHWWRDALITERERSVLVASLVESMDKVANTAGTYYAYLKSTYRKAKRPFVFDFVIPAVGLRGCRAIRNDAIAVVKNKKTDILYLDPPYNSRCYSRYYHLPETIALGATPEVNGTAGMPCNSHQTSQFNSAKFATSALRDIVNSAEARLLIFHYSDDGHIPPKLIREILQTRGRVEDFVLSAVGYTSTKGSRTVSHRLYMVEND